MGSNNSDSGVEKMFKEELEALINKYSVEGNSNTPDFILAEFLVGCLMKFDQAVTRRDNWYGFKPEFQKTETLIQPETDSTAIGKNGD